MIFSGQPTLEKYSPTPTHLLYCQCGFELPLRNEGLLKKSILELQKMQYIFSYFFQKIRQNRPTSKSRPAHGLAGLAFRYGPVKWTLTVNSYLINLWLESLIVLQNLVFTKFWKFQCSICTYWLRQCFELLKKGHYFGIKGHYLG